MSSEEEEEQGMTSSKITVNLVTTNFLMFLASYRVLRFWTEDAAEYLCNTL